MYELNDPWGSQFLSEAFRAWISNQWEDLHDGLKKKAVLDVGGGEGQFYTSLKPLICEYHLLDISPVATARAQERLKGSNHRIFCQSLDSFHPEKNKYGMLWLFSILTFVGASAHPRTFQRMLKKLCSGLQSGGIILLIHPFYSDIERESLVQYSEQIQSFGFKEQSQEDRVIGKQTFFVQSLKKIG